jgi:rubredoxin
MSKNWITVASFSQPVEAHLAKARLEADGITCIVSDEYLVRVDWLLSNAIGGVKLMVPVWEADQAKDVLRPRPRLVVAAGPESEEEMICPRCHTDDVYYTRTFNHFGAGLVVLLLGMVLPIRRRRWTCKQCGYAWKER